MPAGAISAPILGGLIGAGGSVAGGLIGSNAASSAASTQAAAQLQAAAAENANYQFGAARTVPFIQAGEGALNQISDIYGIPYSNDAGISQSNSAASSAALQRFSSSPDYQFAFTQGLQALDRSAAAGGNLLSGGAVKGAEEFGQGLASQQFGNYFNRLLALAGIGQGSAGSLLGNSISAGGQIGNTIASAGSSLASGQLGAANSLVSGLNGAGSSVQQSILLSTLLGNQNANANNASSISGYAPLAINAPGQSFLNS